MRTIVFYVAVYLLFSGVIVHAQSLDQKKTELKKIYEAGGISKIEFEKSKEFLLKSDEIIKEKEKKQSFTLGSKSKKSQINLFKKKDKNKDKEEITLEKIEKLGKIVKYNKSIYPKSMLRKFKGCNNSFKCSGQKAGQILYKSFGGSKSYGQRNPGKMIQAMAMYEVFYASRLYDARKPIQRFKDNKYKKNIFSKKKRDEEAIRSLFGMNNGRKNMREALGMSLDTPKSEAIKKFWLLGEFLDLGTSVKNEKLKIDLKERQNLLAAYKLQIANLKKKLQNDLDEEEDAKTIE
ncbi:hypothetical protein N9J76_01205 [Candidatus Pelagibacter sp.]|nr:hypothetical protein [Candidatus Pelagibacter sp.]